MKINIFAIQTSLSFKIESTNPFLSHKLSKAWKKLNVIEVSPSLKILPIVLEI